jgi:hypothetical protein
MLNTRCRAWEAIAPMFVAPCYERGIAAVRERLMGCCP